jgi:hypothetical protein
MISIPARWPAAVTCMLVLLTLGVNSCGDHHDADGGKGGRAKMKQIKCDSDVDVDAAKGVKKQAVYVCESDTFTWNAKGHKFTVAFNAGSPFTGSSYSDQNPTATAQSQYPELTVYKYTITVDSNPPVDPQVVGGGNP